MKDTGAELPRTRESYSVALHIFYDDVAQSVRASLPQEVKVRGLNPCIVSNFICIGSLTFKTIQFVHGNHTN